MAVNEIQAKSVLRKQKKIDSWFLSSYGMNLYRGCVHNCVYCDGRSEKYPVNHNFGEEVIVKSNAIDILRKELDSRRKRKPFKNGYIILGGGVGDSYQPVEQTYELTRKTLQLLCYYQFPVHILTKSILVKRDIDLLKSIHARKPVIVSMSFSSVDPMISRFVEPGVPSPQERLEVLSQIKKEGIPIGMYLMPVIPFLTDSIAKMEETIKQAKQAGIDFVIFSGMTLKSGRQKEYFYTKIKSRYPEIIARIQQLYTDDAWGSPDRGYMQNIHYQIYAIAKKYQMPLRIPPQYYTSLFNENERAMIILEHLDYLYKIQGKKSTFGFTAYSISKLQQPLSTMKNRLCEIRGAGPKIVELLQEIIDTQHCEFLNQMLFTSGH